MNKTFYFAGCSMTWGHELERKDEQRYSKLVSDHFSATEFNDAWPGGSNWRIVRRLNQYMSVQTPDLVFVMWTSPLRWESVGTGYRGSPYQQLAPRLVRDKNYNAWAKQFNENKPRAEAYEHFYSEVYTKPDRVLHWLQQILAVQNLCKYASVPVVMTTAFRENIEMLQEGFVSHPDVVEEIDWYKQAINWNRWIEQGKWSFRDTVRDAGYEFGEQNHPLQEGHAFAADHLIKCMSRLDDEILL